MTTVTTPSGFEVHIERATGLKELIPAAELGFGKYVTDHMLTVEYHNGEWGRVEIKPYGPLLLDPAAKVLHYGQEIFEGLKAYPQPGSSDSFRLFRIHDNARRFADSAKRLAMAEVPIDLFVESIVELIRVDARWIPQGEGNSLYIRPTLIGTTPQLGVKPADDYLFFVILSPCGPYFGNGFNPCAIIAEPEMARAIPGGTGEAKCGGNYAATLVAGQAAKSQGFSQVLWLDAVNHKYIGEVGAMNIAYVEDGKVFTPRLDGTILKGITRKSLWQAAREILSIEVVEADLDIVETAEKIRDGSITEMFGCGTAAVVSPVNRLRYLDEDLHIHDGEVGPITRRLYETLTGIQYGRIEDPFGWVSIHQA